MVKIWTTQDLKFLTNNYGTLGVIGCSQQLGRSESSLRMKASRLGLKAPNKSRKKTPQEYEQELFDKELDFIPLEDYKTALEPILHQCIQEHTWKVKPNDILSGKGCPHCYCLSKFKTNEAYIKELTNLNIEYVPLESYVSASTPIKHTCSKGHQWSVRPNHILSRRSGCPDCANHQLKYDRVTTLYYIKIGEYYKIGLTQRSISERFADDRDKPITVIFEKSFLDLEEAKVAERNFLAEHKSKRIHISGYLKSNGNTELFIEDVIPR